MPTFSPSLEKALHQALTFANERHHEYATLEHLLLALIDDADAAVLECIAYFDALIEERRARPLDDLLSRLILVDASTDAEAGEPDHLTNDELNNLAALLFLAGFETTTNLIGNGMISLLSQPDQMNALRAHPELCRRRSGCMR